MSTTEISEGEFLTARGAAQLLSCSRWVIYDFAKRRLLPSYALAGSRSLRFKREDVRALLQQRDRTDHADSIEQEPNADVTAAEIAGANEAR